MTLTEEEASGALAVVAKVASLMDQVLGEGGMRRWSIKGVVDTSIYRREIAWVVGRIPYKLVPKAMVVQRIWEQLEAVFPNRILNVWETHRALIPIIVRGVARTPALMEEGIADQLLRSEVRGARWEDRRAYFMYVHGELVLKAEVASAAEAEQMIRNGIMVGGKKCEVRVWVKEMKGKRESISNGGAATTQGQARPRMGRWEAGVLSNVGARGVKGHQTTIPPAPTEPAAMRRPGVGQGQPATGYGNAGGHQVMRPRGRLLSDVKCYSYGLMGHMQYTCTSPSRRAVAGVGNRQGILPVPAQLSMNQNGKRPAAEIPQDVKKPAVGDGAMYGKPYWLAELEKVKEKWVPGADTSKGKPEGERNLENPG